MATVETLEKLERRITLSIPRDEVQAEVDKQIKVRARNARAPGFRPGKVPMKMVEAQYGPEIRANVLHQKIDEAFGAAASESGLRIAGYPRIDGKSGDGVPESHFVFDATFEVYPEVSIGDLSGVEIEKVDVEITGGDVNNTITVLRKRQAHFHVRGEQGEHGDGGSDTTAQNGDMVTVDFNGKIDGVEFEGGKSEGYAFVLGEGQMLQEFDEAVRGMRVGEEKTFPLTFPANYHGKDVAGKTAEFTVSLLQVEWPHMPEINENFVKSLGIASGEVDAMRAEIMDNLVRESDSRVRSINKNNVLDALLKLVEFDVPNALIDQEIKHLMEMAKMNLAQSGKDPKSINLPPEIFSAQADRRVRLGLILGELVEANNLKATPEQIRAQVESLAKSYQDPQMVINYYYGNRDRLAEVESTVIEDNAVNYVLSQAKVTENKVPFQVLMADRMPG